MTDSVATASPPETVEWHIEQKEGFKIYWSGSHQEGDFVQAYAPDSPPEGGKPKVVVYLHGFALCLPDFYKAHLEHLVQQGYYVIFPDFQQSAYPDPDEEKKDRPFAGTWVAFLGRGIVSLIRRKGPTRTARVSDRCRSRKLSNPDLSKQLRVSSALTLIFGLIFLVYFVFERTYSKNLLKLISTVGQSLWNQPSEWVENAIDLSEQTLQRLGQDYPILNQSEPDVVVFGHSLGGLIALSWLTYLTEAQARLKPVQIFTADPATNTELGIPGFAVFILKLFRLPFATAPLEIEKIGQDISVPVTLVKGADDNLVPPELWITSFNSIATLDKKIYFSLSDPKNNPPLIAFHNQAVTNTTYFDDALFNNFGGVKHGPNAYNFQVIWPWVRGVVENNIQPNQLLNELPPKTVQISNTLPDKSTKWRKLLLLLGGLVVLYAVSYLIWHPGSV